MNLNLYVYTYICIYIYMRLMEPHGNDCMEKYLYMQAGGSWGCIVKQSSSDTTFFSMQAEISIVAIVQPTQGASPCHAHWDQFHLVCLLPVGMKFFLLVQSQNL